MQLWEEVRKPLGVVALIGVALGQLPRLTSGAVFPTITALLFVAFFAWLIFGGLRPKRDGDQTTAAFWRREYTRVARWWVLWLVVAVTWLIWGSLQFGFRPVGLVVVAVPLLALAGTLYLRRFPERMAEARRR